MKKITSYLSFIFACYFSFAQQNSVETKLINCIYENFGTKGYEFKIAINNYQKLLINEKIIEDSTGKSYKNTLNKIVKDNSFDFHPSKSFMPEIRKLGGFDSIFFKTCRAFHRINSNSEKLKIEELKKLMDSLSVNENFTPVAYSNGILSILEEKDFEKDYYKIVIFPLFSLIRTDAGLNNNYKKKSDFKTSELKKALKIHINKENELFLYKKRISNEELKKIVREYEIKNNSNSIILYTNDDDTKYGDFLKVLNMIVSEIDLIRENYSHKKYGKSFDSLNEKESKKVEVLYPKNIL